MNDSRVPRGASSLWQPHKTCSLTVNKTLICKLCSQPLLVLSCGGRSYEKYFIVMRMLFFFQMCSDEIVGALTNTYSAAAARSSSGRRCLITHQCCLHPKLSGHAALVNHHPEPHVCLFFNYCGRQLLMRCKFMARCCQSTCPLTTERTLQIPQTLHKYYCKPKHTEQILQCQ